MKVYELPLQCRGCGLEWREKIILPMNIKAFVSRSKGFSVCPKCGSKKVDMLLKAPNPFYIPDKKELDLTVRGSPTPR